MFNITIREMQIKTTMRYHCMTVRMPIIKKSIKINAGEGMEKKEPSCTISVMHWRRKWQPAPVFFPGKFQVQRSLVGYSPWGHKESE